LDELLSQFLDQVKTSPWIDTIQDLVTLPSQALNDLARLKSLAILVAAED